MGGKVVCGVAALLAVAAGCAKTRVTNYVARSSVEEQAEEKRIRAEWSGVRVVAGPPAVFPYVLEQDGRTREMGRYQLYTRVYVENGGAAAVEVLWPEARLEGPEGERIALVETERLASAGRDEPQAYGGPAPGGGAERIEPGQRVVRAMVPETLITMAVDEPLVPLCDACVYRLVIPVRMGGQRQDLVLSFQMEAERERGQGARFLFWH